MVPSESNIRTSLHRRIFEIKSIFPLTKMWRKGNEKGNDDNVKKRKIRKVMMTMWRKGK